MKLLLNQEKFISISLQGFRYLQHFFFQNRQIINDNLPHQFEICSKIFMYQYMPHTDNLFPFHIGKQGFRFVCNIIRCFADISTSLTQANRIIELERNLFKSVSVIYCWISLIASKIWSSLWRSPTLPLINEYFVFIDERLYVLWYGFWGN